MIGFYNYTVILTYLSLISGFVGITFIWQGDVRMALICLMLSGFCDMFDGKVSSTKQRTKSEKRFGIQIDSLCDLICFGLLPSLIVLECGSHKVIPSVICCAYLLAALIRLAWFNVDEEERQDTEDGSRTVYLGLPVTTAAVILPIFIGFGRLFHLPAVKASHWLLLCVGTAFITPFHLKKPQLVGKLVMLAVGIVGCVAVILD